MWKYDILYKNGSEKWIRDETKHTLLKPQLSLIIRSRMFMHIKCIKSI